MTSVANIPFPKTLHHWEQFKLPDDIVLEGRHKIPKDTIVKLASGVNANFLVLPKRSELGRQVFKI